VRLTGAKIEQFLRQPDPRAQVILVYGPDEGLVRERVERLIKTVLDDPRDPFRYTELGTELVRSEPGRLLDEARSLSLIGGRRVVRIRQAGDLLSVACRRLLALDAIEALVVIEAGDLAKSSSLRRLLEAAANGAALPCYRDEGRDLAASIDHLLRERHLAPDADARQFLIEHLGADRGVTRSELDKLALYADAEATGERRPIDLDDVRAVIGDSAALSIDDLVHAVALGQPTAMLRCLDRLLAEGQAPVRLLRSMANHVARLHRLALDSEPSVERVIEQARPPIHFRRKGSFRSQLRSWSPPALATALGALIEAEIACKTTGRPAAVVCRQALLATCHQVPPPGRAAG
jgi:DNA polymerase-3 subunit delta